MKGVAGIWNPNESRVGEYYLRLIKHDADCNFATIVICDHLGKRVTCGNLLNIAFRTGRYSLSMGVTDVVGFDLGDGESIMRMGV